MRADPLRLVRRTRPEPVTGWAASPEGRAALDRVLATDREEPRPVQARRRSRLLLVLVVAGGVFGGSAFSAAVAGRLPFTRGADGYGGMCAQTLSATANLSEPATPFDPRDPAEACARSWRVMYPEAPQPKRFAACYHPWAPGPADEPSARQGGGPVVYPADGYRDPAAACAAIGASPVKLPRSR